MERRRFLKKTASGGAAAAASLWARQILGQGRIPSGQRPDPLLEKVKWAMLTMQRDAWEQGVAAQALLEIGGGGRPTD